LHVSGPLRLAGLYVTIGFERRNMHGLSREVFRVLKARLGEIWPRGVCE